MACALLCAAAFAQSISGCRPRPKLQPDVLLIVIDTLRADRLGAYGYQAPTSPTLDALAKRSVVYENASSTAPFTMPAVAALMTGRYGDRVGVRNHSAGDRLMQSTTTLAEAASSAGYRTAAVVSNPWLARRGSGFEQGFDEYATRNTIAPDEGRLTASTVVDRALEMLDEPTGSDERPLLQWVHFIDTHMPYDPPETFAGMLGNASASSRIIDDFTTDGFDRQSIYFEAAYSDEELERTRKLYDAAIRYVDTEIARLLAAWENRRSRERLTIVISDHGESLGDHGLFFAHDFTLFEELIHVPLIVHDGDTTPGRVASNVSLLDILPTLCRRLTLDCPKDLDGVVLPGPDQAAEGRTIFAVGPPKRRRYARDPWIVVPGLEGRWAMAKRGDTKLLHGPKARGGEWRAFNLANDSREGLDIYDERLHADLREELVVWRTQLHAAGRGAAQAVSPIDRTTRRELRALGYLD